ncbi:MAG TPA: deoxynucleoside kinase [Nitrososphaerales archaeon]|nr:deoxynucleoside kinase [Nitrososphaerales archaeon]
MPPYIVFGGPLASGKTTLAGRLAEHRGTKAIMEVVANHPLLDDFYKDPLTYALETEMIFTIMHYHDVARAVKEGLFEHEVVSDLFFDGVEAYTSYTLSQENRKAFLPLLRTLQERIPAPTQVFYLSSSTEYLMERVRGRGRDYERYMTFEYLDGINTAFKEFIKGYRRAPVTVLDAEELYHLSPSESMEVIESKLLARQANDLTRYR